MGRKNSLAKKQYSDAVCDAVIWMNQKFYMKGQKLLLSILSKCMLDGL